MKPIDVRDAARSKMEIIWSPHAAERLIERHKGSDNDVARAVVLELATTAVRDVVTKQSWVRYWERDMRPLHGERHRGVVENLIVELPLTPKLFAMLRRAEGWRTFVVASVLTAKQFENNKQTLWHRTREDAENGTRATLGHNPFAKLRKP